MQLVKSSESPYIYKVLQNSEKIGKTRVRMQEIAIPSSLNQTPGPP